MKERKRTSRAFSNSSFSLYRGCMFIAIGATKNMCRIPLVLSGCTHHFNTLLILRHVNVLSVAVYPNAGPHFPCHSLNGSNATGSESMKSQPKTCIFWNAICFFGICGRHGLCRALNLRLAEEIFSSSPMY